MKNKKNTKVTNKINEILEVPREISAGNPKLTIIGFDEMLIENYKGILEYEEFYIKINTTIGNINISGFNLSLEQVTEDDISVKGKIESIDIERVIDE
ncbi:MAG: YabP/YqfC family sporulation protein [Clostridia bacterium]|nr:YabP/YqfC family sporulation protein [Clostridia bacterium]